MTVQPSEIISPQLQAVTQLIQGADGVLSFHFSPGTDRVLSRRIELALFRLDAQLSLDFEKSPSRESADIKIEEFSATDEIDPVTGTPKVNVGEATPSNNDWIVNWAAVTEVSPLEIIIHELGHVLGLDHPKPDSPIRANSSLTVMSANRVDHEPGSFFTHTDLSALEILWRPELTPEPNKVPFIDNQVDMTLDSSLAADLQKTINGVPANEQFVNQIYQLVLQRPSDPHGNAYWSNALDNGMGRRGMVDSILMSDETLSLLRTPLTA